MGSIEEAVFRQFEAWNALSPEEQRARRLEMIWERWSGDKPDFMPSGTHDCDVRDIKDLFTEIEALRGELAHEVAMTQEALDMVARFEMRRGPEHSQAVKDVLGHLDTIDPSHWTVMLPAMANSASWLDRLPRADHPSIRTMMIVTASRAIAALEAFDREQGEKS